MNVCFNGSFYPAGTPLLASQNRGFKWGDGLFETMKVHKGQILLSNLHFERLYSGMKLLGIECKQGFTREVAHNILLLTRQNRCDAFSRVRLAVYREEDNGAGYVIEAIPLPEEANRWYAPGLSIDVYPYARKSMDAFANIKSASFLPYVLAAKFAKDCGTDDSLILNANNMVCDSSKANLFLVKGSEIFTPALHQGCVSGVMRRTVIDVLKKTNQRIHEDEISEQQLADADEVFLTNAIQIVRWVRRYKQKEYTCAVTHKIFEAVSEAVFL
jgi:branched-chain amino acid aminotransferase